MNASLAIRVHCWGSLGWPMIPSSTMQKIRPPAETRASMLEGTPSWLRHHMGSAFHWMCWGGFTRVSIDVALLFDPCR